MRIKLSSHINKKIPLFFYSIRYVSIAIKHERTYNCIHKGVSKHFSAAFALSFFFDTNTKLNFEFDIDN